MKHLNYLKELFLVVIVFHTAMLVLIYIMNLVDKYKHPTYKNMNDREVVYFGLLALFFWCWMFSLLEDGTKKSNELYFK